MIALNQPFNGDMEGVRGADLECYKQAREAGYKVGLIGSRLMSPLLDNLPRLPVLTSTGLE